MSLILKDVYFQNINVPYRQKCDLFLNSKESLHSICSIRFNPIGVGRFRIWGGQGLEYCGRPRFRILWGQGLEYWGGKV